MIQDLKMWSEVESPCYQGSGSCASGIITVSNFAGADGRSTAGHVVFLSGGPVIWSSKLMNVVVTSSDEAEVIAAVESVKTASHFSFRIGYD